MERKYCEQCGEPLEPHFKVCPNCGNKLSKDESHQTPPPRGGFERQVFEEGDTAGWAVLGFFLPLVGLILFLVWQEDRPKAARSAGKGALIGVIVQIVFGSFIGTSTL
ncbi:MAG: zinc-ribbon domain-containing protein [Candidatus Izemoplasmataceae bacterium]